MEQIYSERSGTGTDLESTECHCNSFIKDRVALGDIFIEDKAAMGQIYSGQSGTGTGL